MRYKDFLDIIFQNNILLMNKVIQVKADVT